MANREQKYIDAIAQKLEERAAQHESAPFKQYRFRYCDGDDYFGCNLDVLFEGSSIEEALLDIRRYVLTNARCDKGQPIDILEADFDTLLCNFDDIDALENYPLNEVINDQAIDAIIENQLDNDTLWIEPVA